MFTKSLLGFPGSLGDSPMKGSASIPGSGEKDAARLPFRKPRRISITIPDHIYQMLLEHSEQQGRSISNLAAFLLERSIAP